MGIMDNKITRRVALGSIAGGLAGTVAVVSALKGRYRVNVPSGTGTVKVTHKYGDRDITLDVPLKRPSTPQEKKDLVEQLVAQLKKNPTYIQVETQELEKYRDKQRKEVINDHAEMERQQLANLAKQPLTEEEKEAAARAIKESMSVNRAKLLADIDKRAQDDIARLSKP